MTEEKWTCPECGSSDVDIENGELVCFTCNTVLTDTHEQDELTTEVNQ